MDAKFSTYVELLLKWQKSVNLISSKTTDEIWERHIKDSLQLAKLLPEACNSIIDLGSGAGLPGIVLAIETRLPVYLIESDRKKCLFLEEVARRMKLSNVTVLNKRIEEAQIAKTDLTPLVTARAVAELKKLLELINSFLEKNNFQGYKLLLPKGREVEAEITEAKKFWDFNYKLHSSETSPEAKIIIIDEFKKIN